MYKIFSTLLLLCIYGQTIAQTGVKGSVIDQTTSNPLEYANVALYSLPDSTLVKGAVTNTDGSFELTKVDKGSYYLTISFLGYNEKTIEDITVRKSELTALPPVSLAPNEQLLNQVEVSGDRFTTMHKIDRQVFEANSFESSKGGTATDLLRNLPGLSTDASGNISVRGTTGFVVMINGKPIQTDPSVILSQLPANSIKNIEVVTAPSAKYDPEGKAGMINIITSKPVGEGTFVQINTKFGLPSIEPYDNKENPKRYGADFTINHRQGDWDLSVGGSYLRNDLAGRREGDVYTIIGDTTTYFPSYGERSFEEEMYSGRFTLGYTPNKSNQFSLGLYGGKRSKDRTADIIYYDNHAEMNGEDIYQMQYYNENLRIRRSDFVIGSFDYEHTFSNTSKVSSSFLYEYTMLGGPTTNQNLGYPDTDFVYQDEYNTNDNPLHGIRFQTDYTAAPWKIGTFEAGYQFRNLNHTGDFVYERKNNETGVWELVPDFSSNVDLTRQIHSGYGLLSGEKGKWSYSAGLRLEYMDRELDLRDKAGTVDTTYTYDFVKPFPSASLQYQVNDELTLKAAYTKRVQRTTTFKMNPFPEREHSETLEQGDPTLLPEFIDLVELGVIKDFGDNSFYATAYYNDIKNLVNRVNTIYNDTILNRIYSNVGSGKSIGLESGIELNPTSWWKLFAGGNLYKYHIKGEFNNRPIDSSSWVYSINANTNFDISSSLSLQWSLNYLSDRVTAQGEDSRFFSPNLTVTKTFLDGRLSTTLQWLNMDMGLLDTNEQRITTWSENEFYTTTNYVYEVDMIMLNISYTFNQLKNKSRFIKSEFGEKEF
ncbi:TonB-dependent receptor [Echinicola strongylocentroti]|uniref:TonB-dependent receptor n=1 Tax=Echinicola strongylocentroti TaxID=1795355 RepID=A0A2Z4INY6_9BACT|nr:outer membrane beta-barrel family protein [Echinicola strongylocentroti]AWW32470.1 TonB-dependent receptor [Echinicola strongylocentroti]